MRCRCRGPAAPQQAGRLAGAGQAPLACLDRGRGPALLEQSCSDVLVPHPGERATGEREIPDRARLIDARVDSNACTGGRHLRPLLRTIRPRNPKAK